MRGVAGINTSIDERPQSASVHRRRVSVNDLSINGRESPLYSSATTHDVFLGGYSALKNDYRTFYVCHVTCKCEKKNISGALLRIINFSNYLKNHQLFCDKWEFLQSLGFFSIRNINLRKLKGNVIFIIIRIQIIM